MDQATAAFLLIAMLALAGVAAVGVVLMIKISRRRQAARGISHPELDTGVPARPMSQGHAQRLLRRYSWAAATVVVVLLVAAVVVI